MLIPFMNEGPAGVSVMRSDGRIRNFATGEWDLAGSPPTPDQFIPCVRPGVGLYAPIQWAEIPGAESTDLVDDARLHGCFRFGPASCYPIDSKTLCVTGTKVFTWACWYRCKGVATRNANMIGEGSSVSGSPLFQLRTDEVDGTHIGLALRDDAGKLATVIGTRANDAAWHHASAVCDGANLTLYHDGAADGSASVAGLGTITVDRLCLGALFRDKVVCPWTGDLDDVRSYPRALSAAEIRAAASRWLAGPTGGGELSLATWSLAGGVPQLLLDVVPMSWYAAGQPLAGGAR